MATTRSARSTSGSGSGTNSSTSQRGWRWARWERRSRWGAGMYGPVTQTGGIRGQLGLDERLGQRMTVDPAADDAQGKLARGQVREELGRLGPGEFEARALVEVARVAHLFRHLIEHRVLAHGVEHGGITVDPNGVVVLPHGVHVALI